MQLYAYYSGFVTCSDGSTRGSTPRLNMKKDDISELDRNRTSNEYFVDKIITLDECDIPGASLNGKKPSQLNVLQLKRWLACRGAPLAGRKPELIER